MGTAIEHPVSNQVKPSFVILAERQTARISKITKDGLTLSGTGCTHMAAVGVKWLMRKAM